MWDLSVGRDFTGEGPNALPNTIPDAENFCDSNPEFPEYFFLMGNLFTIGITQKTRVET